MADDRSGPTAVGTGAGLLVVLAMVLVAVRSILDWLGHLRRTLLSIANLPLTRAIGVGLAISGALAAGAIAGLVMLRVRATRATLASRVSYLVLASDDFDPSEDAVLRAAAQLSRVRRSVLGWLDPRASAVRVRLDSGSDGRMAYRIEVARRARSVVRAAITSLGPIELREEPELAAPPKTEHVARAELVLARPSSESLGLVGLAPDPLAMFANVVGGVRPGECVSVVLDLLPAAAAQRRRLRGRLLAEARVSEQQGHGLWAALMAVLFPTSAGRGNGQQRASLSEQIERRAEARQLVAKVGEHDPLFQLQALLRVGAASEERAHGHMQALLSAFDAWNGQNWFRVAGLNIFGLAFRGADVSAARRRAFDRRFVSGLHRPSRQNLVTAREVGAFLKPPTKHCVAPNLITLGGSIPAPPPGLPTFRRQRGLLPLGRVADGQGGRRIVGVPLSDTFFCYTAGRSRYGKTELAINQFIHLVRAGHGGLFLDPHDDALQRIKAHLTEQGLVERIVEINLARADRLTSWNLFSMVGHGPNDIEKRVAAIVDSFTSVLGWDERAARAMNLVTQSAQTLLELALRLPPELAPTMFTILSLLSDEGWRQKMLPHFSPASRDFWHSRFPRLPGEAITPVTNLVDRMRASRAIAATFGSPTSAYDIRRAMDEGKIVLACPGAGGLAQNRLVANLLVYDLLHAALTRVELPPEKRRLFYAFIDEAQTCDGASNGNLAALLEQAAKFGVRLHLFNQDPERLTGRTWSAIKTNRSHLMTTVVSAEAAVLLARQWGGDIHPATITRLPRFNFVASVTLAREISRPFLIEGVPASEMWGDVHHPERLEVVERIIGRNGGRQSTDEVLAALDSHDALIAVHLNPGQSTGRTSQ